MSVELKQVQFYYPNSPKQAILNIENWVIADEEKVFLYGPSGCGKSTLLNLISGLHSPSSGTINVLGEQLDTMSASQRDKFRANNIGYIFQQFNLLPYLNAMDNIKLAHHFAKNKNTELNQQITQLLKALSIKEKDWQRPVTELSIGQQQRVGIARAFINKPKLIIADEPTSSLDATARDNFISLITLLCKQYKSTLLFVSHDPQLEKHFDKVQALADINVLEKS